MSSATRVVIFGGLGKVGQALVRQSVAMGCQTSVAVRRPEALLDVFGAGLLSRLTVYEVNSLDPSAVGEAMRGADVAINAAGNSKMGEQFLRICDVFMTQAEVHLRGDKRIWMLGGLAALDIPRTTTSGDQLLVPAQFKLHRHNLDKLKRSNLNWSLACPGPMVGAYKKPRTRPLRVSVDQMPVVFPKRASRLPKPLLTAALFRRIPETKVSYDDVAQTIIEHVSDEAFARRRVGFALPAKGV